MVYEIQRPRQNIESLLFSAHYRSARFFKSICKLCGVSCDITNDYEQLLYTVVTFSVDTRQSGSLAEFDDKNRMLLDGRFSITNLTIETKWYRKLCNELAANRRRKPQRVISVQIGIEEYRKARR